MAIVFSFIIHIKSYHFVGSEICRSDTPRKTQKFKPSTVVDTLIKEIRIDLIICYNLAHVVKYETCWYS